MDLTEKIIKLLMVSLERFMVKFEQVFGGEVVTEALGNHEPPEWMQSNPGSNSSALPPRELTSNKCLNLSASPSLIQEQLQDCN